MKSQLADGGHHTFLHIRTSRTLRGLRETTASRDRPRLPWCQAKDEGDRSRNGRAVPFASGTAAASLGGVAGCSKMMKGHYQALAPRTKRQVREVVVLSPAGARPKMKVIGSGTAEQCHLQVALPRLLGGVAGWSKMLKGHYQALATRTKRQACEVVVLSSAGARPKMELIGSGTGEDGVLRGRGE